MEELCKYKSPQTISTSWVPELVAILVNRSYTRKVIKLAFGKCCQILLLILRFQSQAGTNGGGNVVS
ncbi:hypothetical protein PanWU01x14_331560 [Parasponia andersonii]|uniref:Uncharacterized protein n=1 Tax=Parasponia andersonii TaxID=3476 RepID=A0A2P5AHN8_PARAD|nr:hypothetical protein PanWU01x14_331560 [Parasponia andersonii]